MDSKSTENTKIIIYIWNDSCAFTFTWTFFLLQCSSGYSCTSSLSSSIHSKSVLLHWGQFNILLSPTLIEKTFPHVLHARNSLKVANIDKSKFILNKQNWRLLSLKMKHEFYLLAFLFSRFLWFRYKFSSLSIQYFSRVNKMMSLKQNKKFN